SRRLFAAVLCFVSGASLGKRNARAERCCSAWHRADPALSCRLLYAPHLRSPEISCFTLRSSSVGAGGPAMNCERTPCPHLEEELRHRRRELRSLDARLNPLMVVMSRRRGCTQRASRQGPSIRLGIIYVTLHVSRKGEVSENRCRLG